ncbi:hypothetical protein C8T65DRAFT_653139 [Cerioporus squamosus]|nr:hypothetical protein C8T65DRAFT_653139 [Cerioporus squamosus]
MSATISGPWILDFLVSKAAKAQLVKFLTFPDPGDTAPCNIWVEISDKKHVIHARLSQDAVAKYLQHPLYAGKPITSHKSALVSLKRVRVAFGRVPSRESKGMTKDATLFLDVEEFELKGSFGEAMWGSPVDIASHKDMRDWIRGLRQDGGASNILKQRKAQAVSAAEMAKKTAAETRIQTTMDAMNVKVRVARKSGPRVSSCPKDPVTERPAVSKEALRKASWKRFHTKVVNYFCPSDEVLEHLLTLCGERLPRSAAHRGSPNRSISRSHAGSRSPRRQTRLSGSPSASAPPKPRRSSPLQTPQSSPPRSPSNWSPSVRGSPRQSSEGAPDTEEEPEDAVSGADTDSDDATDGHGIHNTSSTKLGTQSPKYPKHTTGRDSPSLAMPPPPAQPRPRPPPSSVPYATSSPQPLSATAEHADSLPPSSLPAPSPTSSPRYPDSTPTWSAPGVGMLLRDPDSSGEGRVLVENSDTASPGSQRAAFSQSQSQSQSQNQASQEPGQSSQSQRSSKLRNEVGVAETHAEEDPRKSARPESPHGPQGPAAPELEEESQESAKSRQSLSYKGDSQSQDKPDVAQRAPETQVQVTTEAEEHEAPMAVNDVGESLNIGADDAGDGAPQRETSPKASPMPVDPRSPAPQDAPHVAEPSWAAIRATTSPEDGDDSENDVDELLSDQLAFEQEAPAPPRQNRGRKANSHAATTGMGRLDSDDERTAAMVNRYVSQTKQAVPKPWHSGGRQSSPAKRPRESTPVVEQQPEGRALKRRRKDGGGQQAGPSLPPEEDVFTSGDSFREDQRERSSKLKKRERVPPTSSREEGHAPAPAGTARRSDDAFSKVLAHDPTVWAVPTFMRKPDGPKQSTSKTDVAGGGGGGKAALSRKRAARASFPAEDEQPAAKKRKTSSAAVSVSTTVNALLHSRKVPAGSSTAISRPPAASLQESAAHNGSQGVQYVDLRAVSRSTSRLSSRASRAGSGAPRPVPVIRGPDVPASTSSKGKTPMRTVKREEADTLRPSQILPVVSEAKSVSSRNAVKPPTSSARHAPPPRSGTAVSESRTRGPRDDGADATKRLVDEFRASLQPTRTPGGPPLLGWDDLADILLETGRARTEVERAASFNGAGSSKW